MSVRRIDSINSIKELNLNKKTVYTIERGGYTVQDVITAARFGRWWCLKGVGKVRADNIMKAVDEAGFILRESERSHNVRKLLTEAFYVCRINTTEDYEAQIAFSDEQCEAMLGVFDYLEQIERGVLTLRFGLDGDGPKLLREIASVYQCSEPWIFTIQYHALRKLRKDVCRRKIAKIFPEVPGILDNP